MKKAKMLSLTACLVLAITFTLSCSDDKDSGGPGPDGSLNGIWQKIGRDYTFEINGSNAVWKENSSNPDENDVVEGTITYSGSSGSWKIKRGTIPFEYVVSGDTLTISGASADFSVDWVAGLNGQYQKQ